MAEAVVPQDFSARDEMGGQHYPKGDQAQALPEIDHCSDRDLADNTLTSLGYTPELSRNRSTLQVAFMSFVLASIPYGLSTTMVYPLTGGGPANVIWGWVGVSLIILCTAASLGEITSVYPTAGGVYYQAFMLAPEKWRRLSSWVCGWLYLVGNITITLAVNFGTTLFLVACVDIFESEPGVSVWQPETYQIFLVFLAITFLCNIISGLRNGWLPMIDTMAIFFTLVGVLALLISVLVVAANGRHNARYVFGHFEVNSGWTPGWSFCIGLLQAGYATSSTGMIISMCEEVREPAVQVPKAMVLTIILNLFAGLLTLIPMMFVLPDIKMLLALPSGQPVPTILKSALGTPGGAIALLIPLLALALDCGIGCTTATSRCIWAFARDGAVPFSGLWSQVNHKLGVPINAMLMSMVVQIILGVIYFGSAAAFNAFSGVGVICLTAAYAVPIGINVATGRRQVANAKFHLGKLGYFCNIVAIAWSLLAMPLFCMPTSIPVTASTVNYAPAVFAAATMISAAWYIAWGHKNYAGPPTPPEMIVSTSI